METPTHSSAPLLRHSPLDLGNTLSGAVAIVRQRLSTFVLIALLQGVAIGLLVFGAIALFLAGLFVSIQQQSVSGMLVAGGLVMFVAIVGSFLIQIKTQAMMVLEAHDAIHGQKATIGDLFRRTSGVALRMLGLGLALIVGIFLVYGIVTAVFVGAIISAANNNFNGGAGAIAGAFILFVLVSIAAGVAAVYFQVRFLYLIPALAIENRGAVDSLKRSWALTKGNVLRTLGYWLVASIIVGVVSYLVQLISQFAYPRLDMLDETPGMALFAAMVPFMILSMVLSIAVQLLAGPFMASYTTVMYVDQLRRNELPQGFPQGYGQAMPFQEPGPYQADPYQQPGDQQWPQQPGNYGQNPYGDPNQR